MSTTEEKLTELRAAWVRAQVDEYDFALANGDSSYAESPIERLFLAACLLEGWRVGRGSEIGTGAQAVWEFGSNAQTEWAGGVLVHRQNSGILMLSQFPLKLPDRGVRMDYAIVTNFGDRFAIELDGHDFHERTKEQAARDKSRDRLLTEQGWTPVRFTGSEVWRNPRACAEQVMKLVLSALVRDKGRP